MWEFLRGLPGALDDAVDSGIDTARLNDFFNRVLPHASVEEGSRTVADPHVPVGRQVGQLASLV